MTTVPDANVFNLAVKGTFDDCQDMVKALFSDAEFNAKYQLGAINSINWARILAQIVYYFSSYFMIRKRVAADAKIQYAVPTGNFGDILAGYYAKRLGLPMEKLVVATNANDILTRFWKTGRYEKADSSKTTTAQNGSAQTAVVEGSSDGAQAAVTGGVAETLSPAMDILVSSNFERLLFYLALEGCTSNAVAKDGEVDGGQAARVRLACQTVKSWMDSLKKDGRIVVPEPAVEAARRDFLAERASDEQTSESIREYYAASSSPKYGSYVADPHTAVGLNVANRLAKLNSDDANIVQIVLATAHPAKFNAAVSEALETNEAFSFERDVMPPEFRGLLEKERRVIDVENDEQAVKDVIVREVGKLVSVAAAGPNGASI